MKDYIKHHRWKVIEEDFSPGNNRISESIFSIGNGHMGQRANFEEKYSGDTLRGSYIAGIYYPDKTRVGWWKNGYPEYFAKVINSTNWIGINIAIDNEELDLARVKVIRFRRELNMQTGLLSRIFTAELANGKKIEASSKRFVSLADPELGAIQYTVKALNFSGVLKAEIYLDGDIYNQDSNYEEKFWDEIDRTISGNEGFLTMETQKTKFRVCTGMSFFISKENKILQPEIKTISAKKYISGIAEIPLPEGQEILIEKFASVVSSQNYTEEKLAGAAKQAIKRAESKGFAGLFKAHKSRWTKKWETSDIQIEGDVAAQQGIRFNIFQLNQTYTGDDERLNIGPKGFTGEKYGGVTYWDTEAYCLPFYLGTAAQEVAKNLLLYRYKHLPKAIENAAKLGFKDGAALFPMVTINGEECHNEWEITFEEIHRNGAIAYAIRNYINYTGDSGYMAPFGFEVLLAVSRFWSQRINWSSEKQAYVILGVTGPNEYENNVNNNFHTNNMAAWTLRYTLDAIDYMKKEHPFLYYELEQKWKFNELKETARWKDIIKKMYLPFCKKEGVYLQQDGFLDKELAPAENIPADERPINQNWSWDRILRSCYIKQADTLQSLFWFENDYSEEQIKRHFDFYEPLTVHESSLSPCIHTIIAAKIGYYEKAYQLYLRTARLDLDDYNNDTGDGLHITSMGGTWMAFVMGFGGLRARNGKLVFNPFLPDKWKSYSFKINFRKAHLEIKKEKEKFTVRNHSGKTIQLSVWGEERDLPPHSTAGFFKNNNGI